MWFSRDLPTVGRDEGECVGEAIAMPWAEYGSN